MVKELDYTIIDPSERVKIVAEIVENNLDAEFRDYELERLSDYIVFAQEKLEKKQAKEKNEHYTYKHELLTPGRMPTIAKREISYEGLASKLESEDLITHLVKNDKNMILSPKVEITEEDRKNIPFLQEATNAAKYWENVKATRDLDKREAWIVSNAIIDFRKDQYIIKDAFLKPIRSSMSFGSETKIDYSSDTGYENAAGEYVEVSEGFLDYGNPKHIAGIIKNYGELAMVSSDDVQGDIKYILWVFEDLVDKYIKNDYPYFFDIITWRIDKLTNKEIADLVKEKYDISHTPEYISNLATQRIPKIIAEGYMEDYVTWFYRSKGIDNWKTCNRCGETKPRLSRFWSKNKSSKDGFYSICKCCRSTKSKK